MTFKKETKEKENGAGRKQPESRVYYVLSSPLCDQLNQSGKHVYLPNCALKLKYFIEADKQDD